MSRKFRYAVSGRLLPCALLLLFLSATAVFLALWLPRVLAPAAVVERFFSFAAALRTMNAPLPARRKANRLLCIVAFPWLGAAAALLAKNTPPALPAGALPRSGEPLTDAVSAISAAGCGLAGCRAESAEYFPTGRDMEPRFLADLAGAKREILLDYYLLARGEFFDAVLALLLQKVRDGVRISLIYDDFGCGTNLPKHFEKTLKSKGIDAAVFHPVRPFPLGKLNCRDHRKLAVIDRTIAYTGGINLADEYVGKRIRFGHWKDTAVRLTGAPAERFAALFFGEPSLSPAEDGAIPCVAFGDGEERLGTGEEIVLRAIGCARERLYLFTPYLAPTERVFSALCSAALAGVDVRLMIPHIPDKKSVFLLSRRFARELAARGISVREYTAGFLHAKSAVADGAYALIGSYNLDERSLSLQRECGVFLYDEGFAGDVERDFLSCFEAGVPVPKATLREEIFCFFFRLLAPLL